MKCTYCENEIKSEEMFCSECGHKTYINLYKKIDKYNNIKPKKDKLMLLLLFMFLLFAFFVTYKIY